MGTKINPQNAWIILNKDQNSKFNNRLTKTSIFIDDSKQKKNKLEKNMYEVKNKFKKNYTKT